MNEEYEKDDQVFQSNSSLIK